VTVSHATDIAVLVELSSGHARGLIRGISRYAQTHGPWNLHLLEHLRPRDIQRCLKTWQYHGLIAKVKTPAIAEQLCKADIPVVNVSGTTTVGRWRRVDTDDSAVCWMAVSHLLDRGYRSFGFCGMPRYEWSRRRGTLHAAELVRREMICHSIELPSLTFETPLSQKDRSRLVQWIAGIPKPAGILACGDYCGRVVLEVCAEAKVAVPDAVGVIGIDNDEAICELCNPPLSSIESNSDQIGYVAAETLAHLLGGTPPESWEILIKPTKLVGRRSTDAAAVGDPVVAEAIRFIRAYASGDLAVVEIARHVRVSRRYLEQQFRGVLGRSIFSEILRVRLETAQRLLSDTDWKLDVIAERAGFKHASRMSAAFVKKLGFRPGQYRRKMQNRD